MLLASCDVGSVGADSGRGHLPSTPTPDPPLKPQAMGAHLGALQGLQAAELNAADHTAGVEVEWQHSAQHGTLQPG